MDRSGFQNVLVKVANALVRIVMFCPGLIFIYRGIHAMSPSSSWIKPLATSWLIPVINLAFGIICLMPFFTFLFRPRIKLVFLFGLIVISALQFRYLLFPYHYVAKELHDYPNYEAEFRQAMSEGNGFDSDRTVDGKTFWLVHKPDDQVILRIAIITIVIAPLLLFMLRNFEVRNGITWKKVITWSPKGRAT